MVDILETKETLLTFSASFWDNNTAIDPVTNCSIWRHLDASGSNIGSMKRLGIVGKCGDLQPTATRPRWATPTSLANSTRATVIAETAIDQLYWQSNVMCGQSVDNLAPEATDVVAGMVESDLAQVSWFEPEKDYAYEITSDHGFTADLRHLGDGMDV